MILFTGSVALASLAFPITSRASSSVHDQQIRPVLLAAADREDDDVLDDVGRKVRYEGLPGPVKAAIGQETKSGKVLEVRQIRDGRERDVVYRAEIYRGPRTEAIWVNENGKIIRKTNTMEEGRHHIKFNELPGEVKSTMIKRNEGKQPEEVFEITRDKKTWYAAELRNGKVIRVGKHGEILSKSDLPH